MLDGLYRKVNVQIRPVQMMGMDKFDVHQLPDRGLMEPRELLKGDEQFSILDQEPEPVPRDIRDLNVQSGLAACRWKQSILTRLLQPADAR